MTHIGISYRRLIPEMLHSASLEQHQQDRKGFLSADSLASQVSISIRLVDIGCFVVCKDWMGAFFLLLFNCNQKIKRKVVPNHLSKYLFNSVIVSCIICFVFICYFHKIWTFEMTNFIKTVSIILEIKRCFENKYTNTFT